MKANNRNNTTRMFKRLIIAIYVLPILFTGCGLAVTGSTPQEFTSGVERFVGNMCQNAENEAISGMYFNSSNVTEEYEYDDAYMIKYWDEDANLFDAEIQVSEETYYLILKAHRDSVVLEGTLVKDAENSMSVYTFEPENDIEI